MGLTGVGAATGDRGAEEGEILVRGLMPRDVPGLCTLLAASFEKEYAEQGLDVWGFRRHYQLIAWANLLLTPLHLDFFQVSVALLVSAGTERIVGTLASFRAGPRLWYQGFGAVDPAVRRRGMYKRLIRHTLERVAARGGRVGGGEIRTDNPGALRPYRDVFGCQVLPAQAVYMVPTDALPAAPPSPPPPLRRLRQRDFDRLPQAPELCRRFRGGFLLEREAERGFLVSLLRAWLPPLTARSWALWEEGKLLACVRVRTHWPARIRALDLVWFAPELDPARARPVLLTVLAGLRGTTSMPVRIYVGGEDRRLETLCGELGFSYLASLHSIRTDVAAALAATDADGQPRAPTATGD